MAMSGRGGRGDPNRPPRLIVSRVYEQFKPMSEWRQEHDHDTLLVYLPGFIKEYIKVTTEDVNTVRVRGERLLSQNKWSRFQEDYRVPENCEMRGIRAKFDGGILTIIMPRKITNAPAPPPPPPPTMNRVAPKTEEQPFRRTKQEEMIRKPEEPKEKKPDKPAQTARLEDNTLPAPPKPTSSSAPTKKQPSKPAPQAKEVVNTLPAPPKPTSSSAPTKQVQPPSKPAPQAKELAVDTLPAPPKPASSTGPTKQPPTKPASQAKEAVNTLPAPPKPASSTGPTKQQPTKPAPQVDEALGFMTGTLLPRGRFQQDVAKKPGVGKKSDLDRGKGKETTLKEHDVVEKPGVGKKTELDRGKGKETTLEEETKRVFEEKPSSSGVVSGGFRAGLEKVVARRGMENEDRKLLVNVGVGVLIIAALGVHVSYTLGLIGKGK